MNRQPTSALFLFATLAILSSPVSYSSQKPKTAKASNAPAKKDPVKKLPPSEVPGLPPEFLEKLNTRGCSIPRFDPGSSAAATKPAAIGNDPADQSATAPNNAIHGEFARKGQEDWAVLCSKGASSTIVIYWGKPTACPASLARLDDAHYLKLGKDKKQHYSRSIRALSDDELDARPGLATLKPLPHQGIDDRFVGKSSAFFYCNEGKWRIFPAKDSPAAQDSATKKDSTPSN